MAQLPLDKDTAPSIESVHGADSPGADLAADLAVVGGGVIGLGVAWRAAAAGLATVVCDPAPGRGATWAAAGMLAPVTEVHYGEEALLALNLAAARRWSSFAAELEAAGGPVGFRRTGTLLVAADDGDRAFAEALFRFQQELGLEAEWLTASRARALEPALAPGLRGGLWAPGDHQVHNRQLVASLLAACAAAGVVVAREPVEEVVREGGAVAGLRLASGAGVAAPAVVVAAGCRSATLGGVPAEVLPAVRPVKGQILRLLPTGEGPRLGRSVRAVVEGASVYLVPRADGSLVVGATVEEQGFDTSVTAGAVYELLRDARRLVPATAEMVLGEATAGLRPGSPDNGPVVGATSVPGLLLATGHYRNGILLAPLTADAVCALVTGGEVCAELAPFGPERFPGPSLAGAGR